MAHLQYMPGDPRLVDQLVYELKSKGIFDQFRKDCIADVDTRPAYQNLRQRVESSVAAFLSRQIWKPDLNKNQLREKLRKHLLDGNYLEQGVERIVDQVVNPKVASVFIPQVEDLVYNYLGIPRKKNTTNPETSEEKTGDDLLPTDLEAVSPGSVKSNNDKNEAMDIPETKEEMKMEVDSDKANAEIKDDTLIEIIDNDTTAENTKMSIIEVNQESQSSIDKNTTTIPLPSEEIKLENIPAPENSPPNIKDKNIDLEKINLPKEPNLSTDIPLPDEILKIEKDGYYQQLHLGSEDDDSSSDSSLQRNMSPLTPIRNFNNENSYDAQQGFDNDSDSKGEEKAEPSTFRFTIENKTPEKSPDPIKVEKKDPEQVLSYQFNQVNINTFNTPLYEDSSNSNNLQIDYESDANSKATDIKAPETDQNSVDSKKEKKEEKKSSHKSSHRSRDSHRHLSKDKRSESKHSSSRDSNRHDKKSSKDEKTKTTSHKEKSSDKLDKKDSKDGKESSKHRSSSHKSSKEKDSKHRSSSSSKHSSSRHDDRKSSSQKEKSTEKSRDSKDKSKEKSSSHRSDRDKDRKSSSKSKNEEKENKDKKEKKETDDHYSLSGRGNPNRRSTDRDSNDGSSSSKGSHHPSNAKSSATKKETKSNSKSENTSTSDNSTSPSDKDVILAKEHNKANNLNHKTIIQNNRVIRVDTHLKVPITSPPRLPFVPDVTLKKPRFANNLQEAKQMMKMRKFLEEEQKRMNQEAALLLEFQANVRPSLSQVYSSIPGPELEFACVPNNDQLNHSQVIIVEEKYEDNNSAVINDENNECTEESIDDQKDSIAETLIAMHLEHNVNNTRNTRKMEIDVLNDHTEQSRNDIIQTLTDNDEIGDKIDDEDVIITNISENDVTLTNVDNIIENERKETEFFEVTIVTEDVSESEDNKDKNNSLIKNIDDESKENELRYFAEQEKYIAELETDRFSRFLKSYTEKITSKMFLINCDSYEENLIKEVSTNFGNYEIVNYHKNGHLKIPIKNINVIRNVSLITEVVIPPNLDSNSDTKDFSLDTYRGMNTDMFSPVKSESSFEINSDYDAKLEEMVNKTSRQEIMEIILGNIGESPSKMPSIEYCMESSIEFADFVKKRKFSDVESNVNNNITVLTSNKIRKLSCSDQISSTTEETDETSLSTPFHNNTRSKYLGRARRVGLPKPKRTVLPNSPSSDKSVENYSNDSRECTPVRRCKTPRHKVQRYDTSDLYKPKLHYLSRRNVTLND